ncbi:MAG: polysaccharide deacetylase family protein [Clostridia bacterium]|nr:polysaccharide deacetylase family protein [Clostridia bacterium]
MKSKQKGVLVISLDFELFWGVRDSINLHQYRQNLLGVWEAIPAILDIFSEYSIHATWACVGFLFFDDISHLRANLPVYRPCYNNPALDPYKYIDTMEDDSSALFHFAQPLIEKIRACPNQEIASHTFSHYYCLETGQTAEAFAQDLDAAIEVAAEFGVSIESLVFPRNQINDDYIDILKTKGIKAYRGNEDSWIYRETKDEEQTLLHRALRMLDAYISITGTNSVPVDAINENYPCSIPASRFLRPYSKRLRVLDGIRLKRITNEMKYAANNGLVYHLWWHPHNFGINLEENLSFLRQILDCYSRLKDNEAMDSLNMLELARKG